VRGDQGEGGDNDRGDDKGNINVCGDSKCDALVAELIVQSLGTLQPVSTSDTPPSSPSATATTTASSTAAATATSGPSAGQGSSSPFKDISWTPWI